MKKALCILLMMCFLLLQTSTVSGKTLPPGTSANVPPNVLIVFDTSGSMSYAADCPGYSSSYNTHGDGGIGHRGNECNDTNNDSDNPDYYYNVGVLGCPPENDSRMYQGKHVIWDIMDDPSLTEGIRYGLMRFNQDEGALGNSWYYNVQIYYHWNDGCHKGGNLLVECGDNMVSDITSWVDGTEDYPAYLAGTGNNRELRGDGNTPIEDTLMTAKEYFEGDLAESSPIQDVCQNSYVILLTDGQETCGGTPADGADELRRVSYDSDGDGTVETYDVKTFVVGLAQAASAQLDGIAAAGGTGQAFFSTTYAQLYNALAEIIGGIYAENYTATSPLVMPGISGSGNNLYASTFLPYASHQWEGRLRKYPLSSSGLLQGAAPDYTFTWDAGEILGDTGNGNYVSSAARKLFTVDDTSNLNNPSASNYNNFRTTAPYNSDLKSLLGYGADGDTTNTDLLINFVRGKDVFDEDDDGNSTEDRWKLADIYHSNPMEAGSPPYHYMETGYLTFKSTTYNGFNAYTRPKVVYAGSNGGMLHCFDGATGVEKWGFIPPNLLGKLNDMVSVTANQSIPQYYVDSSPVVDDVNIDESGNGTSWWQTLIICGERDGGQGYFTLDVTNPDSPTFLWSVSNDPSLSQIKVWKKTASGISETTHSVGDTDYDYSKLGHTWSVPVTGRVLIDHDGVSGTPAVDRWVAIFGAGYSETADVGTAVYVTDISNGEILKSFSIPDVNGDSVENHVPSPVSVVADDNNYIHSMYVGDLEGKMWKFCISSEDVSIWSSSVLYDAGATGTNKRFIYNQPELSYEDEVDGGYLWVYFGTGDVRNPEASTGSNRFYAIRDDGTIPPVLENVTNKAYSSACSALGIGHNGWYIELSTAEKVLAYPTVHQGVIYFTTFVPNLNDICIIGDAYLYAVHYTRGCPAYSSADGSVGHKIHIGTGMPTAPVVKGGKIYVGVSGSTGGASLPAGWTSQGPMIIGPPASGSTGRPVVPRSWQEVF